MLDVRVNGILTQDDELTDVAGYILRHAFNVSFNGPDRKVDLCGHFSSSCMQRRSGHW